MPVGLHGHGPKALWHPAQSVVQGVGMFRLRLERVDTEPLRVAGARPLTNRTNSFFLVNNYFSQTYLLE
jgi:hypothetical protein